MIIGITGRRLSGKSSVAEYLKNRYGFRTLGFTEDLLKPILIKRKEPVNRRSLIELGMEMRKKHESKAALIKLLSRKISPRRDCAVSGIRFPEEVSFLRKKFGKGFILIAVRASFKTRLQRARTYSRFKESGTGKKGFLEIERLPTERVIPRAMKLADFWVNSDGTKEELEREMDRIMEMLR